MNEQHDLFFKDNFTLGPGFETNYTVGLTSNSITYESILAEISEKINLDDVIGASVVRPDDDDVNNIVSAYIRIYSYPFKKGWLFSARRQRVEYVFEVSSRDSSAENLEVAEKWVRYIRWLLIYKSEHKNLPSKCEGL